jgi:septal ring factor EnvC (AmiA/AmiB activator)
LLATAQQQSGDAIRVFSTLFEEVTNVVQSLAEEHARYARMIEEKKDELRCVEAELVRQREELEKAKAAAAKATSYITEIQNIIIAKT